MDSAIATLLARLETVTARLEQVESQLAGGAKPASSCSGSSSSAAASGGAEAAPWFAEYEAAVNTNIPKLLAAIAKIGSPELKAQGAAFEKLVNAQKDFLHKVATSKKPDDIVLPDLLKDTGSAVSEVIAIRDKARGNSSWNQLSTLSELAPGFGWVQVTPTPAPNWKEYTGNSQFYSNKLIREYKGKDEDQMNFCNALHDFEAAVFELIKKSHTTGLVWNARGGDVSSAPAAAAKVSPPAGGPPPPPPAGNAPVAAKGADMNALFSQINNAGENAALGLKKVTADMKSKNRQDKVSVVKASDKPVPVRKAAVKKGPAKFSLEGNKWVVENQDDNANLVIADTEPKHTVYIYKVDRSVVVIKGKVNSICIDSCNKIGVIFDNAIAQVEMINSTSVELQVTGKVPSFAIDKCGGVQLILSKDCLDAEIVTSKSDAMNVQIPVEGEQDLTEIAIPEQFKTTIVKGKLVTNCVEHV